jgi:hypothetical protein
MTTNLHPIFQQALAPYAHLPQDETHDVLVKAWTQQAAPDLLDALLLALPFVEDCTGDPCYKPGAVSKALKIIRAAIQKAARELTP